MSAPPPFPPLTPLEEMPLHSGRSRDDNGSGLTSWYACEYPERPPDGGVMWDWRCHACVLHARATLQNVGDIILVWRAAPAGERRNVLLSWNLARVEYWAAQ